MASRRPVLPPVQRFYRLTVIRSERVSPSFQRVTAVGTDLEQFAYLGYDHWFRLFTPTPAQDPTARLRLPLSTSKLWWPQYLAIPAADRPHLSNFTVRAFRPESGELDVDVVVHHDEAGEVEGRTALWATAAQPGSQLALLDQGLLYNPPAGSDGVCLVVDETGLPAAEGILRSLAPDTHGLAVLEVPEHADRRPLPHPAGVELHWVSPEPGAHRSGVGGQAALAALRRLPLPGRDGYAFVVGEAELATGARRHLLRQAGLHKDRITFCGFWKHGPADEAAAG